MFTEGPLNKTEDRTLSRSKAIDISFKDVCYKVDVLDKDVDQPPFPCCKVYK